MKLLLCGVLLAAASPARAATFTENFSTNPFNNGWHIFGNTNLFQWDSTNQNLAVTWDSTQTNSYFCHSLGTILTKSDAFSLAFDLQLNDITWTGSPELAVGLFRFSDATNSAFSRPAATSANIFEFDYFPDNGIGQPAIVATLTDTNVNSTSHKDFFFVYDNVPLNTGVSYHIVLTHNAGQTNISGQVSANGQPYTSLPLTFKAPISDFRIDAVSINNYYNPANPIMAHGTVDNFVVTLPPPPVQNMTGAFSNQLWRTGFIAQTNWFYTLQRSTDLLTWSNLVVTNNLSAANLTLTDTNSAGSRAFYRIQATRP